jgi:hypothetical protein
MELRGQVRSAMESRNEGKPEKPYLKIVEPGLTQIGAFEPVLVDRIGRLEIYRPPVDRRSTKRCVSKSHASS